MEEAPVVGGGKKRKFKSDEAIGPSNVTEKLLNSSKGNQAKPTRCRTPNGKSTPKFYLPGSPVLEVKSKFTFGTSDCLPSGDQKLIAEKDGLERTSSFISQSSGFPIRDAENLPKTVPFGRSRRMSRSLPELRDIQFVSVLPDLEEEESETSELQGEEIVSEKPARIPWQRKLDFLWNSACQALGLCNIWRFPYYCYSNGGGSFLLPYLVFMVVCSVPFLCMELAVGQMTQSGPISAFGQLCPLMKGIGVASMMLAFWLTAYYSVLTSWTLFYTFNSFYSPPRWTRCTNTWNSEVCHNPTMLQSADSADSKQIEVTSSFLGLTNNEENVVTAPSLNNFLEEASSQYINASQMSILDENLSMNISHPAVEFLNIKMLEKSDSIDDYGELRFELLASVVFVWILTYFALRKTDFFRGTTIYVLTILSYLLIFSIFLRTVALEGAKTGLKYLFQPDWDEMMRPRVLLYALAQAFHSSGVVLGPTILMGSCHKLHNNLLRDTIILTVVTLLTVLLVGCVTFATIGHLALKMNKSFFTVLNDNPGNVFIIYSVVIASMPLSSCWGVLFFLVLLCLGLDSEVKLLATLISALKEAYTYYIKQRFLGHSLFLAVICGFCFVASIPFLTQAGIFFFQLIDHYIAVIATIIVALLEVCTLNWLYGTGNLSSCIQQMTGKTPSYYYQFSWMILSPLTISVTLIYGLVKVSGIIIKKGYIYPKWANIMGWILVGLTLCWIPFLAATAYKKAPKSNLLNRLKAAIQPRIRSHSQTTWQQKPVIILNGSTVTASEFPDYKLPELPIVPNAVQTYVDKHSAMHQNSETVF